MSADPPSVVFDELLGLHEHARRAAAGVVDAAFVRREHVDQHLDDRPRRVELAALLALGAGELRQEVLVDAAEQVARAVAGAAEADVADHVDQLAEPLLVQALPGEVLGEHALERRVVALDRVHRVVDHLADRRLFGHLEQVRPPRPGRHPEDVVRLVFVGVFGVRTSRFGGREFRVSGFERVGDVFQEYEAKDDVLVFRGVHVVAERIRGFEKLALDSKVTFSGA